MRNTSMFKVFFQLYFECIKDYIIYDTVNMSFKRYCKNKTTVNRSFQRLTSFARENNRLVIDSLKEVS